MPNIPYSEKLKDPRWQKKRLEVFERDGWKCVCCGCDDKTLHIHHEVYFKEPWDCPADRLKTVCEKCHKLVTSANVIARAASSHSDFTVEVLDGFIVAAWKSMGSKVDWEDPWWNWKFEMAIAMEALRFSRRREYA